MGKVNLTQGIENEFDNAYVDKVVAEIEAVPDGETLEMMITCVGGDTFQGDRLNRAVLTHKGHTKATVIGLAASMAGVLLSAFDEVEIDSDAEVMLHKAHVPNAEVDDLTPEQTSMIDKFNKRAFARMSANGVDEELLSAIFLSDETKDFWLTAKEAEEAGIGKAVKVERREGAPFKIAASLDLDLIKSQYKKMNIFSKNKAVARTASLEDGRVVIFNSIEEKISKGDTLQLVGSNELLTGKVKLSATLEAEIDEENKVVDIAEIEAPADEASDEMIAELMSRIETLEKAVGELIGGDEETAEAEAELEAKAEEVEEEKKVAASLFAKVESLSAKVVEASKAIKTVAKLGKIDNKHETIMSGLTEGEAHVRDAIALKNELSKTKIKE